MTRNIGGDVAIVGAGLIGLAIAFELAERGATVRVFDTREPAKAASWAAAGMLAPLTEAIEDPVMQALCESSLAEYPAFVERVRTASTVDPHLRLDGILSTAYSAEQFAVLQSRAAAFRARARSCSLYDREQTLTAEPALGKNITGSLLVHEEGQIDNRRLGRALAAACQARGVIVQTGLHAVAVEADTRRVLGVRTDSGFVPAGAVVNAAGAWAAQVQGVPERCIPPVRPIKGQMLALAIPRGFVRRTTWLPGAYLVPRDDGRLLVGATVEESGFDTRVTARGMHGLLHAVVSAAPSLGDFTVSETWGGLRPGSLDGRPFLGRTPLTGYYLATGHYRNGVLLTPATSRLLADAIEGQAPEEIGPFEIDRPAIGLAMTETTGAAPSTR
ncbi:MAG: glycine oxidase ThiO [Vulcanimicrobiaceae bacterium]